MSVYWPQDPRVSINSVPIYDSIDYVLYICSTFGMWFGISVLSVGEMFRNIWKRIIFRQKVGAVSYHETELGDDFIHQISTIVVNNRNDILDIRKLLNRELNQRKHFDRRKRTVTYSHST